VGVIGPIAPLETVWAALGAPQALKMPTPDLQTKCSSAECAITIIKEPLAAKMQAIKRANKAFIVLEV